MQFTRLGSTGVTVSRLCLGMMTYGAKAWREWVLAGELKALAEPYRPHPVPGYG